MRSITSLLLGMILSGLNLYFLSRVIRRMLSEVGRGKLAGLVIAKSLIFFGIIGLILWKGHVTPLAFLAGFSIPLIGYLCMNLRGSGSSRTR